MAGILENLLGLARNPDLSRTLLYGGLGTLAASGQTRNPLAAIGHGLLTGIGMTQQARQQELENQMMEERAIRQAMYDKIAQGNYEIAQRRMRIEEDTRQAMRQAVEKSAGDPEAFKRNLLSNPNVDPEVVSQLLLEEAKQARAMEMREQPSYRPFTAQVGEETVSGFYNPKQPEERIEIGRGPKFKPEREKEKKEIDETDRMIKLLRNMSSEYVRRFPTHPALGIRIDPATGNKAPTLQEFSKQYYKEIGAQGPVVSEDVGISAGDITVPKTPSGVGPTTNLLGISEEELVKNIDMEIAAGRISREEGFRMMKARGISEERIRQILEGKK